MNEGLQAHHVQMLVATWKVLLSGRSDRLPTGVRIGNESLGQAAGALAGHLVDDRGEWIRIPALRAALRNWHEHVGPEREEYWQHFLAATDLRIPEEGSARQGRSLGRTALHNHVRAVYRWVADAGIPAKAGKLPPDDYQYLAYRPLDTGTYRTCVAEPHRLRAAIDEHVRQTKTRRRHSLEWIARDLVYDDAHRDRLKKRISAMARGKSDYPRALIAGIVRHLDDTRDLVSAASLTYSALKLATFRRTREYLDVTTPDWHAGLERAVPLGLDRPSGARDRNASPVGRRWIQALGDWVDLDPKMLARAPQRRDWIYRVADDERLLSQLAIGGPTDTAVSKHLSALFELAASDVLSTISRPDTSHHLLQALCDVLVYSDLAVRWLDTGTTMVQSLKKGPHDLLVKGESGWELNRRGQRLELWLPANSLSDRTTTAPTRGPYRAAGTVRDIRDIDQLREDLLDAERCHHRVAELTDAVVLHDRALLLRNNPATPGRIPMTRALAEIAISRLRTVEPPPDQAEGYFDALQMLLLDLAIARDPALERLVASTLPPLREGRHRGYGLDITPQMAPALALIYRAVCLVHNKTHRYGRAQQWINVAWLTLHAGGPHWAEKVRFQEAAQQVALQAGGLYMRLLELRLADPRAGSKDLRHLSRISDLALNAVGYAYSTLESLRSGPGLPPNKQYSRSATKAWEVNCRIQLMRALLLRATLHAVEADRAGADQERRRVEAELCTPILQAVPLVYREALQLPLSGVVLDDLTRIAMHYAFLSRMRLLRPGSRGLADPAGASSASLMAHLPPHLRQPGAYGCLDLSLATEYLVSRNNDAGILACIAHPDVVAALSRRSIPEVLVSAVGRISRERLDHSEYQMWLRREREVLDVLRRKIDPMRLLDPVGLIAPATNYEYEASARWS